MNNNEIQNDDPKNHKITCRHFVVLVPKEYKLRFWISQRLLLIVLQSVSFLSENIYQLYDYVIIHKKSLLTIK